VEERVSGSEILDGWRDKKIKTDLAGGGTVEGVLVRSDEIGVLLLLEKLTYATPVGSIEAEAHEEGIPAYCFIPWSQIKVIIPFPGELP
jgi:hypothetical protein